MNNPIYVEKFLESIKSNIIGKTILYYFFIKVGKISRNKTIPSLIIFWICLSSNKDLDLTLYSAVSRKIVSSSVWKNTAMTSICFSICLTSLIIWTSSTFTTRINLNTLWISVSEDVTLLIFICLLRKHYGGIRFYY